MSLKALGYSDKDDCKDLLKWESILWNAPIIAWLDFFDLDFEKVWNNIMKVLSSQSSGVVYAFSFFGFYIYNLFLYKIKY